MGARLIGVPASHPTRAAELMLERKRIPYSRFDLVPAMHRGLLRALRFGANTVPALFIEGRRVQGTREIAIALDALRPDPPLFPADPQRRRTVEEAERWADEVFQPVPRRLSWWALRKQPSSAESFLQGARTGMPVKLGARMTPPFAWLSARNNRSTDDQVRVDLAALPGMLDRVDSYIEEGVVGGEEPNVADYQLATSARLLLCFDDVRSAVEGRPAERLARRLVPDYPGHAPPVFPREWLEPLRAGAATPA